jgi:hypothetical protein
MRVTVGFVQELVLRATERRTDGNHVEFATLVVVNVLKGEFRRGDGVAVIVGVTEPFQMLMQLRVQRAVRSEPFHVERRGA